ncbi:sigma-54 dependent transcriptional regulator [Desulfobacterales bacterium HSG17]|nr:sigma-54 dependent transcriptional regulator [Desulfobacterales bacterium HSG17]
MITMSNILIVDDDETMCKTLLRLVEQMGCKGTCKKTLHSGLAAMQARQYDVVFLDVQLPDGTGLDILPMIMETRVSPEIIIITGHGDINGAELAMKNGVWDYIEKSSSIQDIKLSFSRALQYREQKKEKSHQFNLKRGPIIGSSRKIQSCLDLAANAAGSSSNILITGETGTGKELFARAVHDSSPQSNGNFVVVDCAALPDFLVESMLFGHKKGAFTGADSSRDGVIIHADGGTLFLDEVGELPLSTQKKFLRVLQERRFRPLGNKKEIASHFRLIAATNRDLEQRLNDGKFRKDLFFRIQAIRLELPPLRKRLEDIPAIVHNYINNLQKFTMHKFQEISPEFFEYLEAYHWPGNVRELLNSIEWVLAEAFDEPILFPRHLPVDIRVNAARLKVGSRKIASENRIGELPEMKDYMELMKAQYLTDLMRQSQGRISKACKISGMSRSYLYQLLNKYNIVFRA